jgi:hypothetical protein
MKYITQILCFCTLMGCLTPIDFELEGQTGEVTVYGQVSNFGRRNFVEVGITAGTSRKPVAITSATVFLKDSNGNTFQYQKSLVAGRYELPQFTGIPGTTYWIEVRLTSGAVITSAPDTMPLTVGNDEVGFDFSEDVLTDGDGSVNRLTWLNIRARPTLPQGEKLFLKWSVDEIYLLQPTDFPDPFGTIPPPCYVSGIADAQRITLLRSEDQLEVAEPMLVAKRRYDKAFHVRIYFLTYQSSMSEAAYDYWQKANILSTQVGSIFDTPPAQLHGNLHIQGDETRTIHGYFNALNEGYNKFSLTRGEVPYDLLPYCDYAPSRFEYPRECLNCLVQQGSSYTRPPEFD